MLISNLRLKKRLNDWIRHKLELTISVIKKTDALKLLIDDQWTTSNAFDDHNRLLQASQLTTNW